MLMTLIDAHAACTCYFPQKLAMRMSTHAPRMPTRHTANSSRLLRDQEVCVNALAVLLVSHHQLHELLL